MIAGFVGSKWWYYILNEYRTFPARLIGTLIAAQLATTFFLYERRRGRQRQRQLVVVAASHMHPIRQFDPPPTPPFFFLTHRHHQPTNRSINQSIVITHPPKRKPYSFLEDNTA